MTNTAPVLEYLAAHCVGAECAKTKADIADALGISKRQVEIAVDHLIKYETQWIFSTPSGDYRGYFVATLDDIEAVERSIITQQSRVNEATSRLKSWQHAAYQMRQAALRKQREGAAKQKTFDLTIDKNSEPRI